MQGLKCQNAPEQHSKHHTERPVVRQGRVPTEEKAGQQHDETTTRGLISKQLRTLQKCTFHASGHTHTRTHTHTHAHTPTRTTHAHTRTRHTHTHTHARAHAHHNHARAHTQTHTHMHRCTQAPTHTQTHAHGSQHAVDGRGNHAVSTILVWEPGGIPEACQNSRRRNKTEVGPRGSNRQR